MVRIHLNNMVHIYGICYQMKFRTSADISSFKNLIIIWEDPKCQCNMCNILILICIYDCVHMYIVIIKNELSASVYCLKFDVK